MARSPKILFYIHALAGGGAERVWTVLASALAERGYEVVFAVDYEADDNRHHLRPEIRLVVLGGSHATTLMRLRQLLLSERPDIALSALSASNLKLVLASLLAGRVKRAVLSFHGYAHSEPQLLSRLGFGLAAILTRLAGASVCVSDGLLHYLRRRWGASLSRTGRIYNPVHVGGMAPVVNAASLMARAPVVLAMGRFTSYKNFVNLIRAFAIVDDPDARLVLLGDGPERASIVREVARLGLGARVELPGYVAEPWDYFKRARCFVSPSASESFGLVLVEAMAHGLEIVATPCDGPSEILDGGRYGTFVGRDPASLARGITRALARPSDPKARIERARTFSVETAADRYEAVFRSVMARAAFPRSRKTAMAKPRARDAAAPALRSLFP